MYISYITKGHEKNHFPEPAHFLLSLAPTQVPLSTSTLPARSPTIQPPCHHRTPHTSPTDDGRRTYSQPLPPHPPHQPFPSSFPLVTPTPIIFHYPHLPPYSPPFLHRTFPSSVSIIPLPPPPPIRDPRSPLACVPVPPTACSPRGRQRAPVSNERVASLLCPLPWPTGLRVSLVGVEPSAPPGFTSPAPSRPVLALTSCTRPPLIPLRPARAGLPAASPTRRAQGCPSSTP